MYWGKYKKGPDDGAKPKIHLLEYHCLDVAAVGYVMTQENRFGLADILQKLGLDKKEAAQFFAYLLSIHDIGKFASTFQQLVSLDASEQKNNGLVSEKLRHDVLGLYLWNQLCEDPQRIAEVLPASGLNTRKLCRVLTPWIIMATEHHGSTKEAPRFSNNFTERNVQDAFEYLKAVKKLFHSVRIPDSWTEKQYKKNIAEYSWILSGIMVLCDWIASGETSFEWTDKRISFDEYWKKALLQAKSALSTLPEQPKVSDYSGIKAIFPFINVPTPLQRAASEMDISCPGAQLFILEDLTGSGKTEASLILAQRLMGSGRAEGIFYGLPTMATANAMYERLSHVCDKFYLPDSHPSLILSHSGRKFDERFVSSIWSDKFKSNQESNAETESYVGCSSWFAESNKKALLADVGVGTIDQALMSVMPFRHNNLRLLGLQNKILIVDEIHAYDAYMSKILEDLIKVLAAYGCQIILLSATLSFKQRKSYLDAFGLSVETCCLGEDQIKLSEYPLITHASAKGLRTILLKSKQHKDVGVTWLNHEDQCLSFIKSAAQKGKAVAWIRNTVEDALEAYRKLAADPAIKAQDLILFHSRFAYIDRQRIENEVLEIFGKKSSEVRSGKIIVATQVIEQSLDIDVDEMISDLAPIDLLIQRSGRLHRHRRDSEGRVKKEGNDERDAPNLHIFGPVWTETPADDWYSSCFRAASFVYPDHSILWLTQRALIERDGIHLPEDARLLIESVYGTQVSIPENLKQRAAIQLGKEFSSRAFADLSTINFNAGYGRGSDNYEEDNSTRLSEETVTVWLVKTTGHGILPYAKGEDERAWELSKLSVRQNWWRKYESQFKQLSGEPLNQWCRQRKKDIDFAKVLLIDEPCSFYSKNLGLIGSK